MQRMRAFVERKNLKEKLLVLSMVMTVAAIAACGSMAYFTEEERAENVIRAGNIKIKLQEKQLSPSGETTLPFEDSVNVVPGGTVSKIVQVENVGGQSVWIRASFQMEVTTADGGKEADASLLSLRLNTADWTEREGFYYYNEALAPGQTTAPLLEAVGFFGATDDSYQNGSAVVTVNLWATQSIHNGHSALAAAGWLHAE